MEIKDIKKNKGALLLEILVSIALFLAVSTIIASALFTSFIGGKDSDNKITINDLITEQISKIRALSDEHWSNVGDLERNIDYHIANVDGNYSATSGIFIGDENGIPFKLSFKVLDAYRNFSATETPIVFASGTNIMIDPATLIIVSEGIINKSEPIIIKTILTRWRNIVCSQKDWTASGTPSSTPCETSNVSSGGKTDVEMGDQIKICNGC